MDIIKQLHDLCIAENISISVAESCTSGLIASKITSISGSSAYFKGGIIAYQNEIKVNFLSVSQRMIDEKTEVSSEVVEQMALNVQDKFNSDFSLLEKADASNDFNDCSNALPNSFAFVLSSFTKASLSAI